MSRAWRPRGAEHPCATLTVCGAVLLGVALVLPGPLSCFVAPPRLRPIRGPGPQSLQPWVASDAAERLETPRAEREARTQMHGRYKTGTRSRKNQQGGGRLPIRVTRNPVLSYSNAVLSAGSSSSGSGGEPKLEATGSVIRRMWDLYDVEYNRMAAERQRYFRPGYRRKQWTASYNMRQGRRMKLQGMARRQEAAWADWMRRQGRRMGLTQPVPYNGPTIPTDPEEIEWSNKEGLKKMMGGEEEWLKKCAKRPKGRALVPEDMEDGKWIDDGPENIFKVWKRPLHKWPYDIGKKGQWGPVVRGIVM